LKPDLVILTSFVEGKELSVDAHWSGARWAPDFAKHWPEAEWAKPQDREEGFAWKLSEFGPVGEGDMAKLRTYRSYALSEYRLRYGEIKDWLASAAGQQIVLACWCPFSSVSRSQLARYGTFHCHLGALQTVLEACGVTVELGQRHRDQMVSDIDAG
jgi:hypothetical protein